MNRAAAFCVCVGAAMLMNISAMAQDRAKQTAPITKKAPAQVVQPKRSSPTAGAVSVPSPQVILMMIRETLIALDQANKTGNYTVLRDLSSPDFQRQNNAARLGTIFANLRSKGTNLLPIVLVSPSLDEPATITSDGLLKIFGHIPTKPLRIDFRMLFQVVEGRWRLFGLSVTPVPAAATATQKTKPAATKKRQKKPN